MESNLDNRTSPQPLPSLPPSPTTSEDLSRAHAWTEQDTDDESTPQKKDKGKSREMISLNDEGETSEEEGGGSYPPTNEDAAETRRIEDNLRKWEMAERQRRKAARESMQAPRSLVADVTRRASLLWPGKTKTGSRPSRSERSVLGNHTALASVDSVDVVPMDDIEENPIFSANTSPAASPQVHNSPANPFYHSADASHEQQTVVMGESSQPPTPSAHSEKGKGASQPERPTLIASMSSFTKPPPPPKPLGLPPPRTPPPPTNSSPPTPIASPTLTTASQEQKKPKETRWWHDWLCGLTEGSDRGGDDQAGRTNPFE
ncbi:hypothetical protein PILCRDRAFT_707106 [Piloderma croceum F 1598]|uniref:Uncharacterized protein n=1 Tax=Piloderma croceum (strain F 1598) TaxID=765440 RepID=A0A0C3F307_PILCF|nr:hypothetical protein PILCRDRAFT_707106 [Piloderma croceum F 1598]